MESTGKRKVKKKITEEIKKIINRIKRKWVNPNILVFGDMNESKDSQVTKLERVWKLTNPHLNKTIITREQNMHGKQKESTLDYFMSNKEINNFIRIEQRGDSDHYPLMIDFKISGANNIRRIYTRCNPNRQPTQDQLIKLWNSGRTLKDDKENLKNLYTTINLRPKVFLTAKKINLFKSNEWMDIWEKYKLINKEEYANFIEEIWSYEKSNLK